MGNEKKDLSLFVEVGLWESLFDEVEVTNEGLWQGVMSPHITGSQGWCEIIPGDMESRDQQLFPTPEQDQSIDPGPALTPPSRKAQPQPGRRVEL